jgi:hypothetical protein
MVMKNKNLLQFIFLSFVLHIGMNYSQEVKKPEDFRSANSVALFAGMGINIVRSAGVVDYINSTAFFSQRVSDWGTAVDFFGGIEFPISDSWGIMIEHSYVLKSYTFEANYGTYDITCTVQAPTISLEKVYTGKGYFFKYGAGVGPRFGFLSQKVSYGGTETDYTTTGFGLKTEIVGETAFDKNVFGYIAGDMGYDVFGKIGSNIPSANADVSRLSSEVSMNYFYAGLRFGIMYYF